MPVRLILNADDFGMTRGINRAVFELHQAGVLTSASLMANGPAFDEAVVIARKLTNLGVGCHIVLVDGTPVLPPREIQTLLGRDGRTFRASLPDFISALHLGRIDPAEIAREAAAQIEKLLAAGIAVTHADTHKHTHVFPQVVSALLSVKSIPAIRNPFEPSFARDLSRVSAIRRLQVALINRYKPEFARLARYIPTTDGTLGITATGAMTEYTLAQLLNHLSAEGTYELCCHPGYYDGDLDRAHTRLRSTREIERQALVAVIPKILSLPQPPELIHYGNLEKQT